MWIRRLIAAATVALAGAAAGAPAAEPPPRAVEIRYIPSEDLSRAPGYEPNGVFLPLSELLTLARAAESSSTTPSDSQAVRCTSLRLQGKVGDSIGLSGKLNYEAASTTWSAVRIDDGSVPWSRAVPDKGNSAFLVRIDGATHLFAKGPATGAIQVNALLPPPAPQGTVDVRFGKFFSPTRIDLDLAGRAEVTNWEGIATDAEPGEHGLVTLWPLANSDSLLRVRSRVDLRLRSTLRIEQSRVLKPTGNSVEITDQFVAMDRFTSGTTLKWQIPEGLRVLRARSDMGEVEVLSDGILVRVRSSAKSLSLDVTATADVTGQSVLLEPWSAPRIEMGTREISGQTEDPSLPATWHSRVKLEPSDAVMPVLLEPAAAEAVAGDYEFPSALPKMAVALASRTHVQAPAASCRMRVSEHEAWARYVVETQKAPIHEFVAGLPSGWTLADAVGHRGGTTVPVSVLLHDEELRLRWPHAEIPEKLEFALHRSGPWGSGESEVALDLPFAAFPQVRPMPHELLVTWPDSLDVRITSTSVVKVVPTSEAVADDKDSPARLATRVVGDSPSGTIGIRARQPDVRATVVSALSIAEDRATLRALFIYEMRVAPSDTFKFMLPAGIGQAVRITGEGIRDRILDATPAGDAWTITTQQPVADAFALTAEWTVSDKPLGAPIVAPEVRAMNVGAQRGFVLLEGSETLALAEETRNLAEADQAELPTLPWSSITRVLSVYRYVEPPYLLRVNARKYDPEQSVAGLVSEATLRTTFAASGDRFTRVQYTLLPTAQSQFLELTLPPKATIWSVLVNGDGVRPARRAGEKQSPLLIPLPPAAESGQVSVEALYREARETMRGSTRLAAAGPQVNVPINNTVWYVNLPSDFEYLDYGGTLVNTTAVRLPLANFLRTAYYPERFVFTETPTRVITIATVVIFFFLIILASALRTKARTPVAQPVAEKPAPRQRVGCGLMWEMLIIMGIVAVLAAIAVPNFLEAQVRSKISRVKSDQRSLATGIEAYFVDNNAYPVDPNLIANGPVKYVTSWFTDPMAGRDAPMRYVVGEDAYERAARAGLVPPEQKRSQFWMLYSVGPDAQDDRGELVFDPTNGSVSAGDVVRVSWEAPTQHEPKYAELARVEAKSVPQAAAVPAEAAAAKPSAGIEMGLAKKQISPAKPSGAERRDLAKAEGQTMAGRKEQLGLPVLGSAVAPSEGVAASPATPAAQAPAQWLDDQNLDGDVDIMVAQPEARVQGIRSLKLELPEEGVQRRFEGLGGNAQISIRMIDEETFLRIRFIAWITIVVLLGLLWPLSRAFYRLGLLFVIAVSLIVPVFMPGLPVAMCNTVFQGALFSLIVPLLGWAARRISLRQSSSLASIMIGFSLLGATGQAAPATKDSLSTVAVVVPYGDRLPSPDEDPTAFISRRQFAALWEAQHTTEPVATGQRAYISGIRLDGVLDPEHGRIHGSLSLQLLNASDVPVSIPLRMQELRPTSTSDGAVSIQSTDSGLVAHLPRHWLGTATMEFDLPCEARGTDGQFSLTFPDAASGEWRVKTDLADIQPSSRNGSAHMTIREPAGSVLQGPVRPGTLDIVWTGTAASVATMAGAENAWSIEAAVRTEWNHLAWADWSATLEITPTGDARLTPQEIVLSHDTGLRLTGATGVHLLGMETRDQDVVLRLKPASKSTVTLHGMLGPSQTTGTTQWDVGSLKAAGGMMKTSTVSVAVTDRLRVETENLVGLERKSTREARQGFTTLTFGATDSQWSARLKVQTVPRVFDAVVNEVVLPGSGLLRRLSAVRLTPSGTTLEEVRVQLPADTRVREIQCKTPLTWAQTSETLVIAFGNSAERQHGAAVDLEILMDSDLPVHLDRADVIPLKILAARQTERTFAFALEPDLEVVEISGTNLVNRAPALKDGELAGRLLQAATVTRAYTLTTADPVRLKVAPVAEKASLSAFNVATVSDGLVSLETTVTAEPVRGRVSRLTATLVLPSADVANPEARLQVRGSVRDVRTTRSADGKRMTATIELDSPKAGQVSVSLAYEQAIDTVSSAPLALPFVVPAGLEGTRAYALVRREFEGEMVVAEPGETYKVDPARLQWPGGTLAVQPSDLVMGLPIAGHMPTFSITRHERVEALRAVVELLRQRTIVSEDGVERHEVEIVLQNQSEQFLRLALPYPRKQVSVYQVQVAQRQVGVVFGREAGRDVLLIPLIRTGLLEPELTVRVVYVATGLTPMGWRGSREQSLPEILGGIPVAQSAMVLMLPNSFRYSGFHGDMNRAELIDIEVDEALRQSKQLEKLSQAAFYTKGTAKGKVLSKLNALKSGASGRLGFARKQREAQLRISNEDKSATVQPQQQQQVEAERNRKLEQAELAQQATVSNIAALSQTVATTEKDEQSQEEAVDKAVRFAVGEEAAAGVQPVTPAPPAFSVQFPRVGEAHVFRKLQGTGKLRFDYLSRKVTGRSYDVLFALGFVLVCGFLLAAGPKLVATRRRAGTLLAVLAIAGIMAKVAVDLAIPGLAVAAFLIFLPRQQKTQ